MRLSRHEFLTLALGALPIPFARQDDAPDRIAAVVREYDAQGIHRTGTDVDDRSAVWLRGRATAAGADARLEPFALDRVDVKAAYLQIDGERIEGLPLFDGTFTGPAGIAGTLGADVGLETLDAAGIFSEGQSLAEVRRSGRHRALLVVTNTEGGLTPANAASFAKPFGCPVLQVGAEAGDALRAAAARGGRVTLVAHAVRTPATANNVVAQIGEGRGPVVVMTPRSGWWQCAAERGGGLACWLETMRAVRAANPRRAVLFVASSGHELGHYGLDRFLEKRTGLIEEAAAWIHLGANIGAAGGRMRLQSSDAGIETLGTTALTEAAAPLAQQVPRGTVPAGEARNIHVGGGRYISLLGTSPVFHTRADRYPASVNVPAIARYARAVASVAVALARS